MSIATLKADGNLRAWMSLGSHVDHHNKILYIETPKVACTSLKWLLRGLSTSRAIKFNPRVPETSLKMFVHDRSQSPLTTLIDCPDAEIEQIVTSDDWFRLCVVRHPVERTFSAWKDKVFLCEPGYEQYLREPSRPYVKFDEFVAHIVKKESAEDCDIHWRAQYALLRPDIIPYTKVYDIGAMNTLLGDLKRHLASQGADKKIGPLSEANRGYPLDMRDFLTERINDQLLEFYRIDMKAFGYKPHACGNPEPDYNSVSNAFTAAIFDRNRVISLHSMIPEPPHG